MRTISLLLLMLLSSPASAEITATAARSQGGAIVLTLTGEQGEIHSVWISSGLVVDDTPERIGPNTWVYEDQDVGFGDVTGIDCTDARCTPFDVAWVCEGTVVLEDLASDLTIRVVVASGVCACLMGWILYRHYRTYEKVV